MVSPDHDRNQTVVAITEELVGEIERRTTSVVSHFYTDYAYATVGIIVMLHHGQTSHGIVVCHDRLNLTTYMQSQPIAERLFWYEDPGMLDDLFEAISVTT